MKVLYVFLTVLLGLAFACTAPTPAAPQPATNQIAGTVVPKATSPPTTPVQGWQEKWERTLAAARKEGSVLIYYSAWRPDTATGLPKAFKSRFGIDLELATGPSAEMLTRVEKEKSAGLNLVDFIGSGAGTLIVNYKPKNLLGDIEPLLILPEVTDPGAWGGKLPFIDNDKKALAMLAHMQRFIVYNTDLVKKDEITTFRDLLKPQYKGKIILHDPSFPGPGNNVFMVLALSAWNEAEAVDFLRQLIRQQDVVITRDSRLPVESAARGKYAISVGASPTFVRELVLLGAPIDAAMIKEGSYRSATAGTIGVITRPAHPNAATIFANWLLSKEGQTVFSQLQATQSLRTDVPAEGIDPRFFPQPGEKVFFETEESNVFQLGKFASDLDSVIKGTQK